MLASDSKAFTFDLQENLYFEKGQEVAELRGIALEPEISIQPYDEYISIKGIIELHGEYEKVDAIGNEEQDDLTDFHAKRYVEKVIEEEGVTVFSHQFPVEISVPPYRVADLNEVTVTVESFDYELPEPSHLKLYASIDIRGINGEIEQPREKEIAQVEAVEQVQQVEAENEIESSLESEIDETDSFQFEIRKQKEIEAIEEAEEKEETEETEETVSLAETEVSRSGEVVQETEQEFERETESVSEQVSAIENELQNDQQTEKEIELENNQNNEQVDDPDRWKKKSQTLAEFFNQMSDGEQSTVDDQQDEEIFAEAEDTVDVEDSRPEQQTVEDVSYLSDMFRNTQEDNFTQMRLCIVQEQDTIETIADRFSISPLQLIKQNHLEEDFEVNQGQLLYIPENK